MVCGEFLVRSGRDGILVVSRESSLGCFFCALSSDGAGCAYNRPTHRYPMNLRTSILANYLSQIYVTLISLVLVPVYQRQMGAEAYGLVGFFSTLFSLFYLLDMGLSPTIARETARFHAGGMSVQAFRQLFRAMGLAFGLLALLGAGLIMLSADWIASRWLSVSQLSAHTVWLVLLLMAASVALRWLGGLYRGVLSGGERMVWLPAFNALMATLRFVGVWLAMREWGFTVQVFFVYQLAVAVLELALLAGKTLQLMPGEPVAGWSLQPLKPVLNFSLTTALGGALAVLLLQMDKFLMSGLLPLADYGHFSIAVLVATSVMVVSAPISTALMPRMARLHSERREGEMIAVYRLSTRLTSCVAGGGALALAFCAHPLLTTWTGDAAWAHLFWPVLSLYALGYGLWALAAFPYYLQNARGRLRLYVWGNVLMLAVQVPAVVWATRYAGAVGAGVAWLILAVFSLLVWAAVVHRQLQPGLHWRWLCNDVLIPNWPALAVMAFFHVLPWMPQSRRETFVYVVLVGGLLMTANLVWLAWSQRGLLRQWRGAQ